jgi:hypothetical protein
MFFGIMLIVFAAGSWLLPKYAGTQFFVMSWVDNWGLTTGIVIRVVIGLIGVGLVVNAVRERIKR